MAIDQAIQNDEEILYTSGGRYQVNIKEGRRSPIYWTSASNAIRKCSWFCADSLSENRNLIPYEQNVAEFLEKEYERTMTQSLWNRKIHLQDGSADFILMKDEKIIEHHRMGQIFSVKRGVDNFDIDDGDEGMADHLVLCVSNFGDKIDDNGKKKVNE
jgi:hypothetical protein